MRSEAGRIDAILARHSGREGPLLPILNDVQSELGCIDELAVRHIAQRLNLSRAEVHGVVSFYHDYRTEKGPLPVLKLCRAEACQARGVEALVEHATRVAEGRAEVETVYCLGLCSVGPAAMVGDRVHARLDEARLTQLVRSL